MGTTASRLRATIDLDAIGKSCGFVNVPHSTHDSAYGQIPIPMVVVANGAGPTALLIAGNHGDEYEGQLALVALAQQLLPEHVSGRVIILPALNLPAVQARRRAWPADGGNLNRAFPGNAGGSPTEMIAHYVTTVLIPRADYAVDLHSGGRSLEYLPCTQMRTGGDSEQMSKTHAAIKAFGGKLSYVVNGTNQGGGSTFHATAHSSGVITIATELGGAGGVSKQGLDLANSGLLRLLKHAGIYLPPVEPDAAELKIWSSLDGDSYLLSPDDGIFKPAVQLGEQVQAGQFAGMILSPETPWQAGIEVRFQKSGLVICHRPVGDTCRGDCLFQIVTEYRHDN